MHHTYPSIYPSASQSTYAPQPSSMRGDSHRHPLPGFDAAGSSAHLQDHGGGCAPGPSVVQWSAERHVGHHFDTERGNPQHWPRYPVWQENTIPSGSQAQIDYGHAHPANDAVPQTDFHHIVPTPNLWSTLRNALGDYSASNVPPFRGCANHSASEVPPFRGCANCIVAAAARDADGEMLPSIHNTPHLSPVSVNGWSTLTTAPIHMGQPEMYSHHQSFTRSPYHPGHVLSAYDHQAAYSHSAVTSSSATSSPYPSLSYVDRMDSAFGYLLPDGSQRSHSAGVQSPSPYSSPPKECFDSMDDALQGVPQRTNVSQSEDPLVEVEVEPEHTQLALVPQPRDQLICGWQGCGALVDMDLQALKAHAKEVHGARRGRKRIQCGFVGCMARMQASSLCRHYEGHMVQYSCSCGMTAKSPDHFKDLHGLKGKKKKNVPKHQFTGEAKLVWVTTVAGVDFRYRPTASDIPGVV